MDLLAEQLNEYSRHGIPRLPHLLTFEADEDTEEALYRYTHQARRLVFSRISSFYLLWIQQTLLVYCCTPRKGQSATFGTPLYVVTNVAALLF